MLKRAAILTVLTLFLLTNLMLGRSDEPAEADVQISQQARERQFKSFSFAYSRACPSCTGVYPPPAPTVPTATGRGKVRMATYRVLEENPRTDLYFVDVTIDITDRRGDEDWGWLDVAVQSAGKVQAMDASYTSGVGATNKDTKASYPINLGLSFGPVAAGTTVAHFTTKSKGASITSKAISRGRRYRVNKINGTFHATMARFVRVAAGKKPSFRVNVGWNKESSKMTCATVSNGTRCWVVRSMRGRTVYIGTST